MGLDMYLTRDFHLSTMNMQSEPRRPVRCAIGRLDANAVNIFSRYDAERAKALKIAEILGVSLIGESGLMTVQVPVAYWRKANQIHNWFVENVGGGEDECQNMELGRDQMKALLDLCVTVQADHAQAADLLP